jgi:geranylgeranyl diphosphate synthase type II
LKLPSGYEFHRQRVEMALEQHLDRVSGPDALLVAMRHSLLSGGKRLRPVLLLQTCGLFSGLCRDPLPCACALEFVHTYSLIHDDLPAMDDDDVRRGRPTCHKKFGEAVAILAGDALLTEAFGILASAYGNDAVVAWLVGELAAAAGCAGMVGGQVLDVTQVPESVDRLALENMHRMKTGALIRAAVRCGARLADANDDQLALLTGFAERIGLAFQVADDILDVTGQDAELGKTRGKDQAQNKVTYVDLLGIDQAADHARDLVEQAKSILARTGSRANELVELAEFVVTRNR